MCRERHYWQHKVNYEGDIARPLLRQGCLCYGWRFLVEAKSDFSESNWGALETQIKQKFGYEPRNRYCLQRFLFKMKQGDWVIVPGNGCFSIYEILDEHANTVCNIPEELIKASGISDIVYRNEDGFLNRIDNTPVDIGLYRRVKEVLPEKSKADYVGAKLTSRMKYQMANIGLDDLTNEVINAYNRALKDDKISLHKTFVKHSSDILKSIKEVLEPGKFEKLVEWYFYKLGASSVDIPSKNMAGKEQYEDIDVTALFDQLRLCVHVQVKFHNDISNYEAISQVLKAKETRHYEIAEASHHIYWALTSANDFDDATKKAAADNDVRLVTGKEFLDMLLDAGIKDIDSAF